MSFYLNIGIKTFFADGLKKCSCFKSDAINALFYLVIDWQQVWASAILICAPVMHALSNKKKQISSNMGLRSRQCLKGTRRIVGFLDLYRDVLARLTKRSNENMACNWTLP